MDRPGEVNQGKTSLLCKTGDRLRLVFREKVFQPFFNECVWQGMGGKYMRIPTTWSNSLFLKCFLL